MVDEQFLSSAACRRLKEREGHLVFFPGCSLGELAPELCYSVSAWLNDQGIEVKKFDGCCGLPFLHQGKTDHYEAQKDALSHYFEASQYRTIIAACPNCYYALKGMSEDKGLQWDVFALPEILQEAGSWSGNQLLADVSSIYLHVSCPDYEKRVFVQALNKVVIKKNFEEKKSKIPEKICCGAGGEYSQLGFDQQLKQASTCLKKAKETGAESAVVSCASCAFALSSAGAYLPVFHYLELFFGIRVDWRTRG